MAWALLFAAALAEIGMALALKQSAGWTRWWPSVIGIALALGSFFLLTLAMQRLPMATAYAAWTGIGVIGVAVAGMLLFGESGHPWRLLCLAAILAGIIGLHLLEA